MGLSAPEDWSVARGRPALSKWIGEPDASNGCHGRFIVPCVACVPDERSVPEPISSGRV